MKSLVKFFIALLLTNQALANSIGEDVNNFALAFGSKLEEKDENLAFSPYSIFTNLSLLYFGAEGETASQIKSALHMSATGEHFLYAFHHHFEDLTKEWDLGYQLNVANALFAHKGTHFLTAFKKIAQDNYEAKLQAVDFEVPDSALESINDWVSKKTLGKIPTIMEEGDINASTRLVLANACYFQGDWVYPFRERMTHPAPFHKDDGTSSDARYLHQNTFFPYYEDDALQAVALPFARQATNQPFLECLLILPKKGKVSELEKQLTIEKIDAILRTSKSELIDLSVPKFCFSKRLSLNDPLKALGMTLPFTYGADFSKIDGIKDLFLNEVLHETYFSFHENGVTAASATTSSIGVTALPPRVEPATVFHANHPFLFMIVDYHSRGILFMGRVMKPETEECDED